MLHWIIDDFGHVHRSGSDELARCLGRTDGGAAIEHYAIENIGHIGLIERGERVHIQCRPGLLSERTIASLFYWLLDHGTAQVVVSWLDDVWHMERPMACGAAVSFMNVLLAKSTSQAIGAAQAPFLSAYSHAAKARWVETRAAAVQSVAAETARVGSRSALDKCYNGRWIVVDFDRRAGQFQTVDRGDGYPPLDPGLVGPEKNFKLETMADTHYRDWVFACYRDVVERNQPRFESVDAYVNWQQTGCARTRYWRAVAATHRTDRLCRLLSVSGSDCSIDLRPQHV